MERRNISFRLQSRKAQYIMKGGKVGRKTGYCKPKEEKAEQYSGILKLLSKNYPIKMVSKLEGVSVSTVQRLKKEFCL
jgi:DNA invertase Pin-like site-specific DNA recombinase